MLKVKDITPILNVSDMAASFAWFESWGWEKLWDWGTPPAFGAVGATHSEIFLCLSCQGGRGEAGSWMSVWVDDVDAVYAQCVAAKVDVASPPEDKPWNVREMHVRHPDGHVFRVSQGLGED